MFAKYIIRLDDACPTMHRQNWERMVRLLCKYDLKPVVAVIPNCRDKKLEIDLPDAEFWEKVRRWQSAGWDIGLHGHTHEYVTTEPGLVPLSNKSEFAGQSLEEQRRKIKCALEIFKSENIATKIWIAPSHSFDKNTLKAVTLESDIRMVSDGIAVFPFRKDNFVWVPQQIWRFRKMLFGCWTGCFHPNTMTNSDFQKLECFIKINRTKFVKASDFYGCKSSRSILDYVFEFCFWLLKKYKK